MSLRQEARVLDAVMLPDNRTVSDAAIALWSAACKMQDAGVQGVDAGLLLVVRDKIDAMLTDCPIGVDRQIVEIVA